MIKIFKENSNNNIIIDLTFERFLFAQESLCNNNHKKGLTCLSEEGSFFIFLIFKSKARSRFDVHLC